MTGRLPASSTRAGVCVPRDRLVHSCSGASAATPRRVGSAIYLSRPVQRPTDLPGRHGDFITTGTQSPPLITISHHLTSLRPSTGVSPHLTPPDGECGEAVRRSKSSGGFTWLSPAVLRAHGAGSFSHWVFICSVCAPCHGMALLPAARSLTHSVAVSPSDASH